MAETTTSTNSGGDSEHGATSEAQPDVRRTSDPTEEIIDYARKTYRYLRIAIVAMVLALILSMIFEWLDAGDWLQSISAYYFTAVNPIFIGSLIMIGICLIAIRGTTDFEDIVLNLAGIMAPVVALVPTAFPNGDYAGYLFKPDVDRLINNSTLSLLVAAALAVALAFWLASRFSNQDISRAAIPVNTWIGLVLAAVLIAVLFMIFLAQGQQAAHNAAAIGMFAGLWMVATENVVRYVTDDDGRRSPEAALYAGIGGSLPLLGLALTIVGGWHLYTGENSAAVWLFITAAVSIALVLLSPELVEGAGRFVAVLRAGDWYRRYYIMIAAWMLVAGVAIPLLPVEWSHRTLYLELLQLIPFGIFWLVQTIENWNQSVEHFDYRLEPSAPHAAA